MRRESAVGSIAAAMMIAANVSPGFAGDIDFDTYRVFTTGENHSFLAGGDLNEDGLTDFVLAANRDRRFDDFVSLVLSTGDGGYSMGATYEVPHGARDPFVGDVTGDGHVDVLVPCEFDDRFALLAGDGRGGLSFVGSYPTGHWPWAITSSDFDEDGLADVAVANFLDDSVTIAFGDAFISFPVRLTLPTGDGPQGVATGDFDEDGHVDLAVAAFSSLAVAFHFGDGARGFSPPVIVDVGGSARDLVVADLDGDGHLDVATADDYANGVGVLLGDGAGGFAHVTVYPGGNPVKGITAADFDGDGDVDLLATGHNVGAFLFANAGDGRFLAPLTFFNALGNSKSAVAGQFDRNEAVDFALMWDGGEYIALYHNAGGGRFQEPLQFADESASVGIAAGDLDRDGHVDAVVCGVDRNVLVFLGDGHGGFSASKSSFSDVDSPRALVADDFNEDGIPDVAVAGEAAEIAILLGTGTGRFALDRLLNLPRFTVSLATGDLTGDGHVDLVSVRDETILFRGDGHGNFARMEPVLPELRSPIVGDVTSDGLADLVGVADGSVIAVLPGLGGGTFGAPILSSPQRISGEIAVADFDGDSQLDVFARTSGTPNRTAVLFGDGQGRFSAVLGGPTSGLPLLAADLDGDGHADVAERDESAIVRRGLGDGSFADPVEFGSAEARYSVSADFDEDGLLDLAMLGHAGGVMLINRSDRFDCRRGNVNASAGPPADVLTVDGSAGDGSRRRLFVHANVPVTVGIAAPPAGGSRHYVQWILDGEPLEFDATVAQFEPRHAPLVTLGLGCRCLPIANTIVAGSCSCAGAFPLGRTSKPMLDALAATLCVNRRPAFPRAPTSYEVAFPRGVYTLAGLIADPTAPNAFRLSLMNWVVVQVE